MPYPAPPLNDSIHYCILLLPFGLEVKKLNAIINGSTIFNLYARNLLAYFRKVVKEKMKNL